MLITKDEMNLLCSTPANECSVCARIISTAVHLVGGHYSIPNKKLSHEDREHLEQILRRNL